jgi:uncharacterized delta-60 repeat protein
LALQPDGKVVLIGNFAKFNGTARNGIARLNADGSLDTSFDPGDAANLYSQTLSALSLQTNGALIVAGFFSAIDSVSCNSIARLRPDGSLDASFNLVSGIAGIGNSGYPQSSCVALQTNGQVLVGGLFTATINGTYCNNIARLNSNGSLDTSFNPGTGTPGAGTGSLVNSIALQPDGKVLIGGNFTSINGTNCYGLARLNSDGSMDTNFTFVPIVGSLINCIAVQTNGNILIGGSFGNINGYTRHNIARLNPDGTLDLAFNATAIPSGAVVKALTLQPDGKPIVTGWYFNSINGVANASLVRLNTDGSLDVNFMPTAITGSYGGGIAALALQPDGGVLIGGSFAQINSTNINRIARLNGDAAPATNLQFLASSQYFGMYLQGTVSNIYRIEWTANFNTPSLWTPLLNVTLQTNPQFILDPNPASGQRFYRAVQVSP